MVLVLAQILTTIALRVQAKSLTCIEESILIQPILLSAVYPAGAEEPLTAFKPVVVPSVTTQIEYHASSTSGKASTELKPVSLVKSRLVRPPLPVNVISAIIGARSNHHRHWKSSVVSTFVISKPTT